MTGPARSHPVAFPPGVEAAGGVADAVFGFGRVRYSSRMLNRLVCLALLGLSLAACGRTETPPPEASVTLEGQVSRRPPLDSTDPGRVTISVNVPMERPVVLASAVLDADRRFRFVLPPHETVRPYLASYVLPGFLAGWLSCPGDIRISDPEAMTLWVDYASYPVSFSFMWTEGAARYGLRMGPPHTENDARDAHFREYSLIYSDRPTDVVGTKVCSGGEDPRHNLSTVTLNLHLARGWNVVAFQRIGPLLTYDQKQRWFQIWSTIPSAQAPKTWTLPHLLE